jgi:hypothetical protein
MLSRESWTFPCRTWACANEQLMERLMISLRLVVGVALVPLLTISWCLALGDQEKKAPSTSDILSAWKKREERLRSVMVKWTEVKTKARGSMLSEDEARRKLLGPTPDDKPIPEADVTYDSPSEIAIDGVKMRYWFRGLSWYIPKKTKAMQDYLAVFDGQSSKIFHPIGLNNYPRGTIRDEKTHADVPNIYVRPILVWCRPLNLLLGPFKSAQFVLSKTPGRIGDRDCLVLEDVDSNTGRTQVVWVDSQRNYSVMRLAISHDGKISVQIDMDYERNSQGEWIPKGWSLVWMTGDKLKESAKATISELKCNPTIPADQFQIAFPNGTWVVDMTQKSDSGGARQYIQREGGRQREILPGDRGATYEEIINSEPGEARKKQMSSVSYWIPTLAVLILATGSVWLFVRRRALKPSATGVV